MEKHRIHQVVAELAITDPGITQQIKAGLLRLQIAEIVNGIEICQTGVVQQILLRNIQRWQDVAGLAMQRFQDGPFLPLMDHLTPAKVTRILPEDRKSGKGIIPFNQFF